eukprot:TRINITY_DN70_c0_g1_i1.p1 TRINITY_DN70_c0_g1~~TRINITY_DN70_c0_g1_i1.p1  ORF type:complete len:216 (-),score=13.10 TRINITY_DN70_c0_g1_i1:467-1114(-)
MSSTNTQHASNPPNEFRFFRVPVDVRKVNELVGRGVFLSTDVAAGTVVYERPLSEVRTAYWCDVPEECKPYAIAVPWLTGPLSAGQRSMEIRDSASGDENNRVYAWTPSDDVSAYMNHSCEPSLGPTPGTFCLSATRPLRAGTELTIDYVAFEGPKSGHKEWHFRCQCGAPSCRGSLVNRSSGRSTFAAPRLDAASDARREHAPVPVPLCAAGPV